jgi:CBS domain-containing protein
MDGGRVLRAWLAKRMSLTRATKIAADIGKVFAVLFAIFGILQFNPILVIIAFFIYIGANQESAQVKYNVLLRDLTLGDVMSGPVMTVPPDMPLPQILQLMYTTKHLGFPVVEHGVLAGMITLDDVHKTAEIDREAMQVKDVMTRQVLTLPPSSPLTDALRIMSMKNIGRIPVVLDQNLVGIVTRTDILKVMELREG